MKLLTLSRLTQNSFATYGQITDEENKPLCVTLELPWVDNEHGKSCIPPGAYVAHRFPSPRRGYDVFELDGVPDRGDIELHIGNLPHDSEGCILLGTAFGQINGQPGIVGSGDGFRAFMQAMRTIDTFTLTITDTTLTENAA